MNKQHNPNKELPPQLRGKVHSAEVLIFNTLRQYWTAFYDYSINAWVETTNYTTLQYDIKAWWYLPAYNSAADNET